MKKLLLAILVVLPSILKAQTADVVRERAEQVSRMFTKPGGFDSVFSTDFLSEVPGTQLTAIFTQYQSQYGASTRWYFTDTSSALHAAGRFILQKGFSVDFRISVQEEEPHRIDGFVISNATPLIASLDTVLARIAHLPGKAGILISEVRTVGSTSAPSPIYSRNADSLFALGSSFKLWVLSALVNDIESGKRNWSDVVMLDSVDRSLPSGTMHEWPVGTPVTLATAAAMMISKSDNTATDLLIHTLGRQTVEAALGYTHSSHQDWNTPFLKTLEMFKLKSGSGSLGNKYLTLDRSARRSFLMNEVARVSRDRVRGWAGPRHIDSIEWFGTPTEMSSVLVWLRDHSQSAQTTAFARDVLSINPGINLDRSVWDYIGYKGGSEPGVITMNFLLHSTAGKWYTVTTSWNNGAAVVDEEQFTGLVQRAIELLAQKR